MDSLAYVGYSSPLAGQRLTIDGDINFIQKSPLLVNTPIRYSDQLSSLFDPAAASKKIQALSFETILSTYRSRNGTPVNLIMYLDKYHRSLSPLVFQ